MKLEENQVVLCTVKKIERTTVSLEIEGLQDSEATMIFSEVAAGRIRNIRDYIVPNKKIVCKILRIKGSNIELSLRRVTAKERDEVLERHKKEKTLNSILKPVLKEKTPEVLKKIKEHYELSDFLDEARENPEIIEKFVPKSFFPALIKILSEKKEKDKSVKKTIILKSLSESGIKDIKKILSTKDENTQIHYLGSSKFEIKTTAKDYKTANHSLDNLINYIKENAKKLHMQMEIKEK
ncbi:MAG: hypothetical protein Q8P57_00370 [Candidatus Pacearchaeota archaeon]|nr:hypothetical protein [Candidatus Pacearchaeota archaeon]